MIYDADGIHDSIKNQGHWSESTETPTLTLFLQNLENRSLRRVRQLGVIGVSMAGLDTGGLETWTDDNLKRHIDRATDADLELRNIMFNPSARVRFGEAGRDEDIDTINRAIRIAGRQGLPVMEYNLSLIHISEPTRP